MNGEISWAWKSHKTENPRKINKKNKKIIRSNYIIRNISEIIPGKIYCKKKKRTLI